MGRAEPGPDQQTKNQNKTTVRSSSLARHQWDDHRGPGQQTAKSKKDDGKNDVTVSSSVGRAEPGPDQQTKNQNKTTVRSSSLARHQWDDHRGPGQQTAKSK